MFLGNQCCHVSFHPHNHLAPQEDMAVYECGDLGASVYDQRWLRVATGDTPFLLTIDYCNTNTYAPLQIFSFLEGAECSTIQFCYSAFQSIYSFEECPIGSIGGVAGLSKITYPLSQNQVYYLNFLALSYTSFEVVLRSSPLAVPENDLCSDAFAITTRTPVEGTTNGAGYDADISNPFGCVLISDLGPRSPDVWYKFNSGQSSALYVDTCYQGSSASPLLFYITSLEECGDPVTCTLDGTGSSASCSDVIHTALQLDTNYYLVVSGYQIVTSDFSFVPYFSQLNAICSRAFTISSLPYSYTGFVDAGLTDNRCATNAFSVWFKFNSGGGYTSITLNTCNSNFDTVLSITTSCDPSVIPSCFRQADGGCSSGLGSFIPAFDLDGPPQDYFIRVSSKQYIFNTAYTLEMTGEAVPVDANTVCSNAINVETFPYTFSGNTNGPNSVLSACNESPSPTSWFIITAPQYGYDLMTVTVTSTFANPVIVVRAGCTGPCVGYTSTGTWVMSDIPGGQVLAIGVNGRGSRVIDYTINISVVSRYSSPVIICPPDRVVFASPSTCRYSGTTGTPNVIALDSSGTPSFSKFPKGPYGIGTGTITYTAVHPVVSSFTSSCVQRLTVQKAVGSQC